MKVNLPYAFLPKQWAKTDLWNVPLVFRFKRSNRLSRGTVCFERVAESGKKPVTIFSSLVGKQKTKQNKNTFQCQ